MAQVKTRYARPVRVLVYFDEPQLILLRKGKSSYIAVAVPSEEPGRYLAVSLNPGNWERYLADRVDLRYLFTYPKRNHFYFQLSDRRGDDVRMHRYDEVVPEEHLPDQGFFASEHTEHEVTEEDAFHIENLKLDGTWDLPELGAFQQKLSDVYTFLYSIEDWRQSPSASDQRRSIANAFTGKPFRGGSSYGSYFQDLDDRLKMSERVRLKSIQKASPGFMEIAGNGEIFSEVQDLIENFLQNHNSLIEKYNRIHRDLSKKRLLKRSVSNYTEVDPNHQLLVKYAEELSDGLGLTCLEEVNQITAKNSLGTLKIVLALFRRIQSASEYFAQGRAAFN